MTPRNLAASNGQKGSAARSLSLRPARGTAIGSSPNAHSRNGSYCLCALARRYGLWASVATTNPLPPLLPPSASRSSPSPFRANMMHAALVHPAHMCTYSDCSPAHICRAFCTHGRPAEPRQSSAGFSPACRSLADTCAGARASACASVAAATPRRGPRLTVQTGYGTGPAGAAPAGVGCAAL
jgi:hypothetical protein